MINKRLFIMQIIILIVLIFIAVYILSHDMHMREGSMTRKEINSAMQELPQITNSNDSDPNRISQLKELAKRVGAGTINTKIVGAIATNNGYTTQQNPISESELVQNINQALQTHMMLDACKTANRQYKIAVLAAIVAVIGTIITWNISIKEK